MAKSKREELGQIVIRPPEGMRELIKEAAEANNRSMNAEIVARLQATFDLSGVSLQHRIRHPLTDKDREEQGFHARQLIEIRRRLDQMIDAAQAAAAPSDQKEK